jgi:hypothetical protein
MKSVHVVTMALACSLAAHADFSYTQSQKATGGMGRGMVPDRVNKHYQKGQKMKMESGTTATIMDFDAQTLTTINNADKTYTVMKFSDLAQTLKDTGADVQIDVKDTGQRKSINGLNCNQVIMTMSVEGIQGMPPGMKMQMEMEIWLSGDVPGAAEVHAFYQKNADKLVYAMGGAGNAQMQKPMAAMMRKLASVGGVPVLQIVRMKSAGAAAPTMSDAQSQQMQQAMAQMEAMKKQGGPQAAAMEQAMARMGAARGAMGGGGGSLFEMTMESSGFSTSSVPDSVFEIPAGYTKK